MKKIIFFFVFLIMALSVSWIHFYYLNSTQVYINKDRLSHFSNISPFSEEICDQSHTLEYYYYQDPENFSDRNNKFGLYIYPDNERFIELADKLVNSNGGDWGYVLLPFNVDHVDKEKWQRIFYLLNKKHLIPIVQLWNVSYDKYKEQTDKSVEILDSLVWPIKTRYISVYNEPNDAAFWSGRVDPKEYAMVLDYTIDKFKETNSDFFMLNGAFNVSASNTKSTMDAFNYMIAMDNEIPGIFKKLDGWASHSYPQPHFSGNVTDTGRNSIKAYETELSFLNTEFGVSSLPVFITETGWAHDIGKNYDSSFGSMSKVASNFRDAYEKVWLPDDRVRAVTPFSIWYEPPYDHFSWVDDRLMPYEQFQLVKSMKKTKGTPPSLVISTIDTLGCTE